MRGHQTSVVLIYIVFRCLLSAVVLLLVFADGVISGEPVPGPEELVHKTESYFKNFDRFRATWLVVYGRADREVRGDETKWEILKDGEKAKVIVFGKNPPAFRPPQNSADLSERILERLEEQHKRRYERKEFIAIPGKRNLQVFATDSVLSEVQPTQETARRILGNTPFALCYGILEFEPILDLLRSMDLRARVDELDGSEVYVLSGSSKDGGLNVEIALDPKVADVVRSIRYQKRIPNSGSVAQYVSVTHRQSNFKEQDGVLTPMTAERAVIGPPRPRLFDEIGKKVTHNDESGNVIMEPQVAKMVFQELQSIDYDPVFVEADFEPTVPINNGVRVHMQDARQLQYEWKDGEPAPVVPDIPMGHEFIQEGKPSARLYMILSALVLLCLAALVMYYHQRRGRS